MRGAGWAPPAPPPRALCAPYSCGHCGCARAPPSPPARRCGGRVRGAGGRRPARRGRDRPLSPRARAAAAAPLQRFIKSGRRARPVVFNIQLGRRGEDPTKNVRHHPQEGRHRHTQGKVREHDQRRARVHYHDPRREGRGDGQDGRRRRRHVPQGRVRRADVLPKAARDRARRDRRHYRLWGVRQDRPHRRPAAPLAGHGRLPQERRKVGHYNREPERPHAKGRLDAAL